MVKVVRISDMTSSQICGFVFGGTCLNGYDPKHDWLVEFPPGLKPPELHPTELPELGGDTPYLKVLQISDTHFDPLYAEGANAECEDPLCCRQDNGPPKTGSAAAGKWGTYRKCDTPRRLLDNALRHIAETHRVRGIESLYAFSCAFLYIFIVGSLINCQIIVEVLTSKESR